MKTILIIEDDQQLRDMLLYFLADIEGYKVFTHTTGAEAVDKIIELNPNLVLLDVQLPHTNGLKVLSDLRAQGGQQSVIVMTANDNELTETNALSLGANDYITKPIRTSSLRERIKRQFSTPDFQSRTIENSQLPSVEKEAVDPVVDTKCYRLVYRNSHMKLLPSDVEVLLSLVKGDKPKTVSEIFFDIHGFEAPVSDRSVYMRISSLRKRICSNWAGLDLIKNHRAKGFFLTQKVIIK